MYYKHDPMDLYRYFMDYRERNGNSPTYREMAQYLGTSSTSTTRNVVNKLIGMGLLARVEDPKTGRPHLIPVGGGYNER